MDDQPSDQAEEELGEIWDLSPQAGQNHKKKNPEISISPEVGVFEAGISLEGVKMCEFYIHIHVFSQLILIAGQILRNGKILFCQDPNFDVANSAKSMVQIMLTVMFAMLSFVGDVGICKLRIKKACLPRVQSLMKKLITTWQKKYRQYWCLGLVMNSKQICTGMIEIQLGSASLEKIANCLYFETMEGTRL